MAAGSNAYWSDLTGQGGAIVARGRRTTNSTGSTGTEVPFLRLDNIPIEIGHAYHIITNGANIDTSIDNDCGDLRFRAVQATTAGTVATTASTLLSRFRNIIDNNAASNLIPGSAFYFATADGFLSVLLSVTRVTGTGTVILFASASDYFDVVVKDLGVDPGNTAVIL